MSCHLAVNTRSSTIGEYIRETGDGSRKSEVFQFFLFLFKCETAVGWGTAVIVNARCCNSLTARTELRSAKQTIDFNKSLQIYRCFDIADISCWLSFVSIVLLFLKIKERWHH